MNESSVSAGIDPVDACFQRTMESLTKLKESIDRLYYHLGKAQGIIETMEIYYGLPVQDKEGRCAVNEVESLKLSDDKEVFSDSSPWQVAIPYGTKIIGRYAFCREKKIATVVIPSTVTHIGGSAFQMCVNLVRCDIPGCVTHIGEYAFAECKSLQSVFLTERVKSIGEDAFEGCDKLTIDVCEGSYAEKYVKDHNLKHYVFKQMDGVWSFKN